jgi:Protein of unknown function (DUF4238)
MNNQYITELKQKLQDALDLAKQDWLTPEEIIVQQRQIDNLEKIVYPDGSNKERQHYVPRCLLEWFTESGDEDGLFVYDISKKQYLNKGGKIPLAKVLTEKNLYVFKDKSGQDNFFFEKFVFSMYLEGWLKEIIWKIERHEKLSIEDWQRLSGFIIYQFTRTKKFIIGIWRRFWELYKRNWQESLKNFNAFCKVMEELGIKDNLAETHKILLEWKFDTVLSQEDAMIKAMASAHELQPLFLNAHYEVMETRKNNFFLCSDNPFFIIPPYNFPRNRWLWLIYPLSAEKIIPISKKICLRIHIYPEDQKHGVSLSYSSINQKMTNRINQFICKNADKYVLSKEKGYLDQVLKTIDYRRLQQDNNRENITFDDNLSLLIWNFFYPY